MTPYASITHPVPLIPQSAENTCWAACMAMILSWKSGSRVTEASIIKTSQAGNAALNTHGLDPNDRSALQANGFTTDRPRVYNVDSITLLLRDRGPLWVATMMPEGGPHIRVVTGIEGTDVFVNDPWPVNKGEQYRRPFSVFHGRMDVLKQLHKFDGEPSPVYVGYLQ